MNFSASLKINGNSIPFLVNVVNDEPSFKSFKIDWKITAGSRDMIELKFNYFWEKTWNLLKDYYSYDVLSWADKVHYKFSLPSIYSFKSIDASFIDLYGNEWPSIGSTVMKSNMFEWNGSRLPIFSTIIIKYETQEIGS